jgi:hypothetical protein
MDLATEVMPNAMFALHALTVSDLEQWSQTELWEWADERVKALAANYGLFVERTGLTETGDIPFAAKQNLIPLPADHLATVRVESAGVLIKPANVVEIQSYDDDWDETTGPVITRWIGDALRVPFITPYPKPLAAGTLSLVYEQEAPAISATETVMPHLASVAGDVVTLHMIAEARRLETDAQIPECVSFAEQLAALYSKVIESYFGGGM